MQLLGVTRDINSVQPQPLYLTVEAYGDNSRDQISSLDRYIAATDNC
jgi:hypothetical protein